MSKVTLQVEIIHFVVLNEATERVVLISLSNIKIQHQQELGNGVRVRTTTQ